MRGAPRNRGLTAGTVGVGCEPASESTEPSFLHGAAAADRPQSGRGRGQRGKTDLSTSVAKSAGSPHGVCRLGQTGSPP